MKFLRDFFPVLLFFIAYQLFDIYTATATAIAASLLQVGLEWLLTGRVEIMHQVTLLLLVVFGGLTLLLRDPLFIKWKPTVVNWLFSLTFLGSRWIGGKPMIARLLEKSVRLSSSAWNRLNTLWILFFLAMGALNLYVAFNFPESVWVNFKLFGMLGLTLAFVIAQAFYLARHMQPEENQEES